MKRDDRVLIRKRASTPDPICPTPPSNQYRAGEINYGVSLPIAYEIECELVNDIVAGEAITALRHKRNGEQVLGVFQSTPVVSIETGEDYTLVSTANSVYEVVPLSPEPTETVEI
jgi:hypothetical protein